MSILSTNKRIIKVGQDYSAGENIGIYDHTISSRNWKPDITYASESAYSRSTAYTNDWIEGQYANDLTATNERITNLSDDVNYISGVAITAHQSLYGYLTKASGDEYYQPKGSYATLTQLENTSGEIVNLIPTDFVTNETLEQTSGNIVNLIPDTSEFITNASAEATYQPIGNYLSSNALEGYATQEWVDEQGYITGVDLSNYYTKNETSGADELANAFSQIGPGGDEEVNSFVYDNSAKINDVNSSYQSNSGNFLTAAPSNMATTGDVAELAQTISETYQTKGDYLVRSDSANFYPTNNPSGFITGVDLSNYYTKDETSGKEELANAFANIPVGDPEVNAYVTSNSASIDESTNLVQSNSSTWNDVTAYQSNSGSYLTAHQDISNKLDVSAFSDVSGTFYTNDNPSGFITGVDLSNYYTKSETSGASEIADALPTYEYDYTNKISAINGSAIAAGDGGEIPTGTMNVSGLEYNAVNEISAYNGSAISQYGAEKQWLVHDDTLVHAANSAQYALGVNLSAVAQLLGIDETVLWSGSQTLNNEITLSESRHNFNSLKMWYSTTNGEGGNVGVMEIPMMGANTGTQFNLESNVAFSQGTAAGFHIHWTYYVSATDTKMKVLNAFWWGKQNAGGLEGATGTWGQGTNQQCPRVYKIIGIGRKA